MNWKDIKINGISGIERLVTELRLSSFSFPYLHCNFRIYETQDGRFICRSEIAVRNKETNKFEKIVCEGSSPEIAFDTTVTRLFEKIAKNIEGFVPDQHIYAEDGYTIYLKNHEY